MKTMSEYQNKTREFVLDSILHPEDAIRDQEIDQEREQAEYCDAREDEKFMWGEPETNL